MARTRSAELLDTIAHLEHENALLRNALDTGGAPVNPYQGLPPNPGRRRTQHRHWSWTLLAAVLLTLGAVLAPLATVASWAKVQLTDTDSFVAIYAPLAHDAGVQAFVADQTVAVIEANVDVPALTSEVFDGIIDLGTGPGATQALESLKGPAAQGIISLVRSTVGSFVESDAFAQVWQESLRVSHTQLTAALQNDPEAAIAVGADGSVGIALAPIIERVKAVLLERGLTFAAQIPAVDRTIVVAQDSSLPTLQLFYSLALVAGAWLPWISLAFLAAGVAVARRRALALVWAAVALALGMAVVVAGIAVGRLLFIASVSPPLLPAGVARTVFDTLTTSMASTGVAVLVLAVVVAVVAWAAGPFTIPTNLRELLGGGTAWLRGAAERQGITTGRAGEWMFAQRVLIRMVIAVTAAAIVLLSRPLTTGTVLWTLVLALFAVAVVELVQRPAPPSFPPSTDGGDTAATAVE